MAPVVFVPGRLQNPAALDTVLHTQAMGLAGEHPLLARELRPFPNGPVDTNQGTFHVAPRDVNYETLKLAPADQSQVIAD